MTVTAPAPAPTCAGGDFAGLSKVVGAAGLLTRRPTYYVLSIGIVGALFAAVGRRRGTTSSQRAFPACRGHSLIDDSYQVTRYPAS